MNRPALLALGEYRPATVRTNDELSRTVDTSDEWVRRRTGIASRRIAGPTESVVGMAADAAAKALAQAGVPAAEVDLVVLATCSMPSPMPGGAAQVAHRVGATAAGAFDLNAACAGFCYALSVAADAVRAGSARHVVVVGSERMSDLVDWTDRGTCVLFGDGAGAVLVGPGERDGVGPVVWGADGSLGGLIEVPDRVGTIRMDGRAVYRWTTTVLPALARRTCTAAGITPADLAAVVPHQANLRIVDALVAALDAPQAVVATDIVETGNTSAASVPLALHRLVSTGAVRSGDPALLFAFGAGLTYAGQVVRVP